MFELKWYIMWWFQNGFDFESNMIFLISSMNCFRNVKVPTGVKNDVWFLKRPRPDMGILFVDTETALTTVYVEWWSRTKWLDLALFAGFEERERWWIDPGTCANLKWLKQHRLTGPSGLATPSEHLFFDFIRLGLYYYSCWFWLVHLYLG